jgi:RNA polymerase sigma factor (sigma-70 family)
METKTDSIWMRTRASLIASLKEENEQASWDEFYQMYWRTIYGYGLRFGLARDDAEDLVQEVVIKIFRALPTFEYDRSKGRFLSWVKTITRRTVLDVVRRRKSRIEGQIQIQPRDDTDSPIDHIPDPNAREPPDPWQAEWEQSLLILALERVKERIEKVTFDTFDMYALQNKPAKEVARVLDITTASVYVYKSRVLKMLQKEVIAIQNEI